MGAYGWVAPDHAPLVAALTAVAFVGIHIVAGWPRRWVGEGFQWPRVRPGAFAALVFGASLLTLGEVAVFVASTKDASGAAALTPLTLLLAVAVAPLIEEIVLRLWLQQRLATLLNGWAAIGIVAFAFALLHETDLTLPSFWYHFVTGCCYGSAAWISGSIWPAIIAHAIHNGVLALLEGSALMRIVSEDPASFHGEAAALAPIALIVGGVVWIVFLCRARAQSAAL